MTLTCVSDPVEGPSVDGYTCGTPLHSVLDGRNALLAVAMNGTALPVGASGYPSAQVTVRAT